MFCMLHVHVHVHVVQSVGRPGGFSTVIVICIRSLYSVHQVLITFLKPYPPDDGQSTGYKSHPDPTLRG